MPITRVKTGVPGLDELMEGGLIPGSAVLVAGHTGAGKTLFCLQFLWNGLQKGEPGVYISFEQTPEELKDDAMVFGWNFDSYERKGMCKIAFYNPFEIADVNKLVTDEIGKVRAKRVVIDSTSVFAMYLNDEFKVREKLYKLIEKLKQTGCTILMTSEILEESKGFSRYGVEEFVADAVLALYYTGLGGEEYNNIEIRKMRRTKHARGYFPLEFTNEGLKVIPQSTVPIR
ncbi:MAG: AAA family ATPase [Candidatus Aenigmarchaeota archaeon]|nr:AAA family ATPase [Candidatus Aenigmarchaeota archaeon]